MCSYTHVPVYIWDRMGKNARCACRIGYLTAYESRLRGLLLRLLYQPAVTMIGLTIAGTVSAEQRACGGTLRRTAMTMNHSRKTALLFRSLSCAEGSLLHPLKQLGQRATAEYCRKTKMHSQSEDVYGDAERVSGCATKLACYQLAC